MYGYLPVRGKGGFNLAIVLSSASLVLQNGVVQQCLTIVLVGTSEPFGSLYICVCNTTA